MGEQPLPRPVTTEACYLAAILAEIQALKAKLATRLEREPELVELKEPERKPRKPKG